MTDQSLTQAAMGASKQPADRIGFQSAGVVRKLTLAGLHRLVGQNAEFLTMVDLEYANELLAKGHPTSQVVNYAIKWANEYARVSDCEGREANRFHADAYGN